uniref:Adenosine deaminase-like protein n=1 Tax=Zeugodacus cucurbitae TaxID=28588 RepID=A0A0A1X993_ZEUCU
MDMSSFIQKMPKIELHAHLNGSLCTKSIRELCEQLFGVNSNEQTLLSEELTNFDGVNLEKCFLKFRFIHDLTATKRGLQLATELVIRDFAKDNVIYLELRTTPKRNSEMSKVEYVESVLEAIERAKKYQNIHVNLLLSIDRGQSVAEAEETVDIALQLQDRHKDLISGIDFSGNPKLGNFAHFISVLEKAQQNNLKLALHCAEIQNPEEIDEMIKLGMERCGHGTFLSDHHLNEIYTKNIAIECCLTSNVKCSTVESYDDHHFKHIFNAKKSSVVLCTDDCGIFDTTLSNEFVLAKNCFNLKKNDLQQLSSNAVEHAFTSEIIKNNLRHIIRNYFETQSELESEI